MFITKVIQEASDALLLKLSIANFATANWVKPPQPAKPIFLTPTLLMRALPAMPASNNTKESLVTRLPEREAHTVQLTIHCVSHYNNLMSTSEFAFNHKKLAVETWIAHNPKMQASKQKVDLLNHVVII